MKASTTRPVVALVWWWVRLYTVGMSPEARESRRAEMESDLWEQERDTMTRGYKPVTVGLQVMGRWLLGIPEDLSWRFEQIGASKSVHQDKEGKASMNGAVVRAPMAVTLILGLGIAFLAASILIFWIPWGIRVPFGLLGAVMVFGGFFLSRRLSPSVRWVPIVALVPLGAWMFGGSLFVLALALPLIGIMGVRHLLKRRKALP